MPHDYNGQCRFEYQPSWETNPWLWNFARGVRWTGWYTVEIWIELKDGVPTGARDTRIKAGNQWRSYWMNGCAYDSGPRRTVTTCAVKIGPVELSGPNRVLNNRGTYDPRDDIREGDYGAVGSPLPARVGRDPIDHHPRDEVDVNTSAQPGRWVRSGPTGRVPVSGYEDPTNFGPGIYNHRTLPREPWRVRQSSPARDWVFKGEFGKAYERDGRYYPNLYGLGNNSASLAAYDACLGQRAEFPEREGLHGYGNYKLDVDRLLTDCTVYDYPRYGFRIFDGCSGPRQQTTTQWIISSCQGRMELSSSPNTMRNFDPSQCVTGDRDDVSGRGQAACTWAQPVGYNPTISTPQDRSLAQGQNSGVNSQADGRKWQVRYPAPLEMKIYPIEGPEFNPVNQQKVWQVDPGRPLDANLDNTSGSGHRTTKWLLWNVGMASTPWTLSKTDRFEDGTRRHGNTNPNARNQPFGTRVGHDESTGGWDYSKLSRFGTGSTTRDPDGPALRSPGQLAAKDVGESRTGWSEPRRTMQIWFKQPGAFPAATSVFLSLPERCIQYPSIAACTQSKNFATRARFFQMFRVSLIEGAFMGFRSPSPNGVPTGDLSGPIWDQADRPANRYGHVVVGECRTDWNSFKVLGPRPMTG
jgi:hypothetical protein